MWHGGKGTVREVKSMEVVRHMAVYQLGRMVMAAAQLPYLATTSALLHVYPVVAVITTSSPAWSLKKRYPLYPLACTSSAVEQVVAEIDR